MPTQYRVRTWCKTCNDWTLHKDFELAEKARGLKCVSCETIFEGLVPEIPEEKIQEQRERYSNSLFETKKSTLLNFGRPKRGLLDMMSEEWPAPIILEDDAGQKQIDDAKIKASWKKIAEDAEKKRLHDIERKRYTVLGRNDACACGSGVKYKKCCLSKYV